MTKSEIYNQYIADCALIAQECESEGKPSHGSDYEIRCQQLWEEFYLPDLED